MAMSDAAVDKVKIAGRFIAWTRKHSDRASWNLSADDVACDGLIRLLETMSNSRWASCRTLRATKPTLTPDGLTFPILAASQIELIHKKDSPNAKSWTLSAANSRLAIEFGSDYIPDLIAAVAAMKSGEGDFRLGNDECPLWFWWWIEECITKRK